MASMNDCWVLGFASGVGKTLKLGSTVAIAVDAGCIQGDMLVGLL